MASSLTATALQVNGTQSITGISTTLNNSNTEVPTSKAVKDFIDNMIPVSLTVSGNWTNTQYTLQPVDTTGLTFTVTYKNGITASVVPSVLPSVWSDTVGTQTATFYYTESGVTVSASKSATVVETDWRTVPLTLYAREAGAVSISKTGDPGTIYYSKNGGSQTELPSGTNVYVVAGDRVSFYRTLSNNLDNYNCFIINCTNNCYVYGNIMSIYNKDNFANLTTITYTYAFIKLFYLNNHIDINESVGKLVLPATTLANNCYAGMFRGCTSLTIAPVLPATTLANSCYNSMFWSCTSLTTVPSNMLPATTLTHGCYSYMFYDCTSLTIAPVLPATTLINSCYYVMFYDCTSLTSITCLATSINATYSTGEWVTNVASSGTFRTPSSTAWTTGVDGIPSGWTRVNV